MVIREPVLGVHRAARALLFGAPLLRHRPQGGITFEEVTMRSARLLAALLLALVAAAAAQERPRSAGGFDLAVHALWSWQLEDGSSEGSPGAGVGLGYRLPIGLAVELRGSYRSWESLSYLPLHLGLRYDLPLHPLVTLAPFAGFGPSLVWGNDWGSVFASFDLGARVYLAMGQDAKVRLWFEGAYGRGMAFHPSEFGVVNLAAGLSLRL